MFSYVAYGLQIASALRLPELPEGEGAPDVVIHLGRLDPPAGVPDDPARAAWADARTVHFYLPGIGTFLVRDGREIIVDPAPGASPQLLRLVILEPASALLLHQRGFLVLHASAVALGGAAVGFLGAPGQGKSTTAAALVARGHPLLADDVLVVRTDTAAPVVHPGYPQLKLWPETALTIGEAPEGLFELHPLIHKRLRRAAEGFSSAPLPLRALYLLADGPVFAREPVRTREALIELVRNSYCARLLKTGGALEHFRQCASLAERGAVHRLLRPRDLSALPALVRLLEQDDETKKRNDSRGGSVASVTSP
jgi:hypothetical protein